MKFVKTKFKDLLVYKGKRLNDKRGYLKELFRANQFQAKFSFDLVSFSKKNVIRGLHLQSQNAQDKLITTLYGKVFDVVVDCRKNSKTFSKVFTIILSDENNRSLFVPKGFAHGFCALTDKVIMHYRCSNYRDQASEIGILWNDKDLKIKWPVKKPIISKKDKKNISFKDFSVQHLSF